MILLILAAVLVTNSLGQDPEPEVSTACLTCLCKVATLCKLNDGCTEGHCGPYHITQAYWDDAGKPVQVGDDPKNKLSWQTCALDVHCAKTIVKGYMKRFGQDCNSDGQTNCYDYLMINVNGGFGCTTPLNKTENGRTLQRRYQEHCVGTL